ncbi:uncharacterized protein EV154DRAFT_576811 [Mucor mucedo]|uniref:uncharacterized protein n=1 Tax=Mucor mucedo TaxID=29922 RepID=UPI00221FBC9B|nr:uncharacterized protein EV154DRAFT_576811 [Mucor mucedo]KAI7877667.1 hypothetical protein EV154DRAFT_576811 [Mucor mucedo]
MSNNNTPRQERPDVVSTASPRGPVLKRKSQGDQDYAALAAKVNSLSACVADLQRKLDQAPAAGPVAKMNRGKQTELVRLVHHAYERCVNRDKMPFNLNGSMVKDNSHVRDQIIKYCKESAYFDRFLLSNKTGFTIRGKEIVEGVILSFLNNKKVKAKNDASPPEVTQFKRTEKRVKERRSRKLARRLAIYKSHPEETPAFATAAECLKVLVNGCQSDEEDVPGDKTLLDRQVPTWRSKNLNDFFKRLDKVHDDEATRKWGEKKRVDSVVVTALHPDLERKLPAWSKAV